MHPKQLRAIGFPNTAAISVALAVLKKYYKFTPESEALDLLTHILNNPHDYWTNPMLSKITEKLIERPKPVVESFDLRPNALNFNTFGAENIEAGAIRQLQTAMRLPLNLFFSEGLINLHKLVSAGVHIFLGGVLTTHIEKLKVVI